MQDETKDEKYCINCGEEECFGYERATAAYSCDLTTNHYICNNCGEKFSWIEPKQ